MIVCRSGDYLDPLGHNPPPLICTLPRQKVGSSPEVYSPKVKDFYFKDWPHRHFISLGDVYRRLTLYALREEMVGILENGGPVEATV